MGELDFLTVQQQAQVYIKTLKSPARREYAQKYLAWILNGKKEDEHPLMTISYIHASIIATQLSHLK